MPGVFNPTVGNVKEDVLLKDFSVGIFPSMNNVWNKIIPQVPVDVESGKILKPVRDEFWKDEVQAAAPGDAAEEIQFKYGNITYTCAAFPVKKFIPDRTIRNAAPIIQQRFRKHATMLVTGRISLKFEKLAASTFSGSAAGLSWTNSKANLAATSFTNVVKWNTLATSDPLENVFEAFQTIELRVGGKLQFPAKRGLLIGSDVYRILIGHPDVTDRMKVTDDKVANEQRLASLMRVDSLVVADTVSGQTESAAGTRMWGAKFVLAYMTPSTDLVTGEDPSAFYFYKNQDMRITTWRENDPEGEWIKGEMIGGFAIQEPNMGYYIEDVLV